MESVNKAISAIKYYLSAKNKYQIHSPFIVDFYNNVIEDDRHYYAFDEVETLRKKIEASDMELETKTYGQPSKVKRVNRISKMVKKVSAPPWKGKFLFRLSKWYQPKYIVELGTNLGIGSLYLHLGKASAPMFTIEGNPNLVKLSRQHFKALNVHKIEIIEGLFADRLNEVLSKVDNKALIYVDGHHDGSALISYTNEIHSHCKEYEQYCLCLDDINWSDSMRKAWATLKEDKRWQFSVDLYHSGLLFYNTNQRKNPPVSLIKTGFKPVLY